MAVLRPPLNPLAYPAGILPGFDPSHVAAGGAYLSALPAGGTFYNVISGRRGTNGGSPTAKIASHFGPAITYPSGASTTIGGLPAITTTGTAAAFFQAPAYSGTQVILQTTGGSTVAGFILFANTTTLTVQVNGSNASLFTGLVANAPYFVAYSMFGTTGFAVLLNLATGNLQRVDVPVSGINLTGADNVPIIGAFVSGLPLLGDIGPVMISSPFTPQSALLAWAKDPWAFWYPRLKMPALFSTAAGATGPFAAFCTPQQDPLATTYMLGY